MANSSEAQPGPSDETLAELERCIENDVGAVDSSRDGTLVFDAAYIEAHKRLFQIVDDITAPIRMALCLGESPPVLDDYDELVEIGRGGMGVVYRAKHVKTQRTDAIKVIRPDRLSSVAPERLQNSIVSSYDSDGRSLLSMLGGDLFRHVLCQERELLDYIPMARSCMVGSSHCIDDRPVSQSGHL